MKKIFALTLCLALVLGCLQAGVSISPDAKAVTGIPTSNTVKNASKDKENYVKGEALVTLAVPKGAESDLLKVGPLHGDRAIRINRVMCFDDATPLGCTKKERKTLRGKNMYVVHVTTSSYSTQKLMGFLEKYSHVYSVSKNYIRKKRSMPTDPLFDEQWSLGGKNFFTSNSSGTLDATIGFTPEEKKDFGKDTPIVAVMDDGVDYTKEDLKNMMWENPYSKKKLPGKYGYDFVNKDDDPMPEDGDSHATAIAGIIAAESDNGIGIAGICKNVKIMSLRTNYNGEGPFDLDFAAFEYIYKAMKLGANVVAVNCSYGVDPFKYEKKDFTKSMRFYDVAANKIGAMGAVTVFCASNEGKDTDIYKYGLPAQLKSPYIIKVGASTYEGKPCFFSNYGKKSVDLFAPGDDLISYTSKRTFLPDSYSAEKRAKLCLRFDDLSDTSCKSVKTISDVDPVKASAIKLSHSDWDFHGDKDSGSLRISFLKTRHTNTDAYRIFFDVTDLNLDIKKEYYYSYEYLPEEDGLGTWIQSGGGISRDLGVDIITKGSRTYFSLDFAMIMEDFGDLVGKSVLIDSFAISVGNPDRKEFGDLKYVGGTSFSAPIVAAGIARISELYPKDDALTRRAKIMASTRKLDGLKGTCVSEGVLDMSKFDSVADVK